MGIHSSIMKLLTLWVLLAPILDGTFASFWDEDSDKDQWIYSLQASMFDIALHEGGMKPMKFDELGYAGSSIIEVWLDQHCSIKADGEKSDECRRCFVDAYENVTQTIQCTKRFLPEKYMKCWNMEHSNDTVIASINIIRCFKDTWFNFAFQDCLKDVNSWFHEDGSKE